MEALNASFFTDFTIDPEVRALRFRAAALEIKRSFRRNALFPHLSRLIQLRSELEAFLNALDTFQAGQPRRLVEIDLIRKELTYEAQPVDPSIEATAGLIRSVLPEISALIEEGRVVFDFVEEQLQLLTVGVEPVYKAEGYLLVPDPEASAVHVFRYEISLFTAADERFRSLKTAPVRTLEPDEQRMPWNTVKLGLIREQPDLPNPAMFAIETGLEVPFKETLFPVSKRVLLRKVG